MINKKKLLLVVLMILILLILGFTGYYLYSAFTVSQEYQSVIKEVEQQGLNTIGGIILAIEGRNLRVMARVPEEFTPFSGGGYKYIEKEYLLKTLESTEIWLSLNNKDFNQLMDLSAIKSGDGFSAVAKQNILDSNELDISELIIYR